LAATLRYLVDFRPKKRCICLFKLLKFLLDELTALFVINSNK
jgi:hypothetical protein